MNEQFKAKLLEWMSGLEKAGVAAVEFSKNELPDLFKQITVFGAYKHGFWLGVGVFIWLLMAVAFTWAYSVCARNKDGKVDENVIGPIAAMCFFGFLIGLIFVACNVSDFIMAVWAPKLYIIEYMKDFIK